VLLGFVIIYLIISIGIGVYGATKVHNSRDYVTAGRSLPLPMVMAMVFATWFGAETVLGIPATFIDEDMGGLISDPFGASLCLVLFGLFFARPLYRMNLLTIGDFYRNKYNRFVEVMVAIAIALSYLGWVAAQVTALGLVFSVLSDGSITQTQGVIIGASVVLIYTLYGGMWSVALTTFVQMIVIVVGLLWITWLVSDMTGGIAPVISHAHEAGKFNFWPELNSIAMLTFIAGLLTMGFGSIPQQDVFQRANASKNENIAAWGSIGGGIAYFLFAAVPLFLAYSATLIDPTKVTALLAAGNAEHILPTLVIDHLPTYAQVIFYGALLSVIMSTASGTLLAPSVTISENILKGMFGRMSDAHFLRMMRIVVVLFTVGVTAYALWAVGRDTGIHRMVENAYKVTLVMAFTPLVAGIYWKRASGQGAVFAILLGLLFWIPLEIVAPEGGIPPQFAGFIMSVIGMVAGSLLPDLPWLKKAHHRHKQAG
jgi:SSS family solute:Na+ symporter